MLLCCIRRYDQLLTLVHSVNGASLLVGGPGTAKTTVINQFIGKFNSELVVSKTITFSSLTTPQIFQMAIEGAVEKRQGRCVPDCVGHCWKQQSGHPEFSKPSAWQGDACSTGGQGAWLTCCLLPLQDVWPTWWQAHVRVC
jgi:hypothetical protein